MVLTYVKTLFVHLQVCLLVIENPGIEVTDEAAEANSVKKVIILADAIGIPENYNNIRVLWNNK